jgi:anti-sigma regulatory factor (Ser/Thr protein kinase)
MGVDPRPRSPSDALTLDPLAQAVADARHYVRDALPALGGQSVIDNAQLIVSELVTNATLHARTPMTVRIGRTATGNIRIAVVDHSPMIPQPRSYALTATTGRGLRLVEAVSIAWGVEPLPPDEGPGKIVWAEPAPDEAAVAMRDEWSAVISELACLDDVRAREVA